MPRTDTCTPPPTQPVLATALPPGVPLCSSPSTSPGGQGWQAANDPALARHTGPIQLRMTVHQGPFCGTHVHKHGRVVQQHARQLHRCLLGGLCHALRCAEHHPRREVPAQNRSAGERRTSPQNDIRNKPSSHAKPSSRRKTHPRSATDTAMAEMFSETASTRVMAVDCKQDRCAGSAGRGAQLQRAQVNLQCRIPGGRGARKDTRRPLCLGQAAGWLHGLGFAWNPVDGTCCMPRH